ncbi:MAG: hypothetical protein ABR881_00525 [Candidatus Sulfotelmatobacter sp.]
MTDVPCPTSSVASVRLSVCQPMRLVIFARTAAGRMIRLSIAHGQYGCCPPILGDGKQ